VPQLDAIVVGAGLSGLVCARRLVAQGARVVVLEARDRVGGRLCNGELAGGLVDLGGTWMSSGQARLLALADELGVDSFAEPRQGRAQLDEPGGTLRQLGRAVLQLRAMRRLEQMAEAVKRAGADAAAGEAEAAAAFDARSLEDWLAREVRNPHVRARLALHADLVLAADRSSLSLLHYLVTLGATGGFGARGAKAGELPGGGREHRFVGGAQALALRMAEQLGDVVRTGEPVLAIEDVGEGERGTGSASGSGSGSGSGSASGSGSGSGSGTGSGTGSGSGSASGTGSGSASSAPAGFATVRTAAATYRARRVILALPPALARMIDVALPPPARAFAEAVRPGAVVKVFAAYARAFWRERGLSGELYAPRGLVRASVEATPPRESGGAPTLLAFVVGPEARSWSARSASERRAAALASLAAQLGDEAAHPIAVLEHDWATDAWAGGCVAGLPPGALGGGAAWRRAHGRLHFAGTEAAVAWPGYMDGALEAGERAAAEVISALGSTSTDQA
jgi:monoamine oxidase